MDSNTKIAAPVYTDYEKPAKYPHPISYLENVAFYEDAGFKEVVSIEEAIKAAKLGEIMALEWSIDRTKAEVIKRITELKDSIK